MAAGDVHRELTIAGEPFCGLLGTTARQKNPFVLKTDYLCQYVDLHLNIYSSACLVLVAYIKHAVMPCVASSECIPSSSSSLGVVYFP